MAGVNTAIRVDDRMSPALFAITNAMNLMYSSFTATQSAVNTGLDSAGMEAARQAIVSASAAATEYQEQLERLSQAPVAPTPPEPVWQSTNQPEVFMSSGAERFGSEIRAANQMAQKLWQTQRNLTSQAAQTRIVSPQMMRDLNEVNGKIWNLQGRIQELSNLPVNLRTDRTNNEIEALRQRLQQATEAQADLNDAISQMDVTAANAAYQRLNATVDSTRQDIRNNLTAQEQFNRSLESGSAKASGLEGTIKRCAAAILSAVTAGKIVSVADQVTQTTARLDLMNQRFGETENLQQKIYESAQRSRGAYQTTADAVSKLGMQARDAFANTDEVVAFAEQLNKTFVVAGTSAQGVDSVMLQLTQSMAAGKLQGEELNAVLDNAQPIVQNIADYMGVPVGQIKELASEGTITAEIIKNAMFAAADETNAKFTQMPMTFGQVAGLMKNQALMAFQPALQQLSAVAQTPEFQSLINGITAGIQMMATGSVQALNILGQAALFVQENLWWLVPAIAGVTAALVAYKGAVLAYNIVQGISNGLKMASAALTAVHTTATLADASAHIAEAAGCSAASAAQWAFNSALLACPLTWVILAIIAVVAVIAIWVNRIGGLRIAWLTAVNFVLTWVDKLRLGFMMAWMNIQNGVDNMAYGFEAFRAGVLNTLGNLRAKGLMILQNFINSAVQMVNDLINTVNAITGAGIATITWTANFGSQAVVEEAEKKKQRADNLASTKAQNEADAKERLWNQMRTQGEMDSARAAREADIKRLKQEGAAQKVSQTASGAGSAGIAAADYGDIAGNIGNTAGNTGNTAANTAAMADAMDVIDEDLKYMRDAAEQEIINRFTLAELKVDVNNNNTLKTQTDFDDVNRMLGEATAEILAAAAEGVYV